MRHAAIAIALVLALLVFLYHGIPGYLLADSEYRRLVDQHPKSRAEVDRILKTSPRPIRKAESDFGRHTGLSGDFERYSFLGAPIDVVYDKDGRVLVILPSYE